MAFEIRALLFLADDYQLEIFYRTMHNMRFLLFFVYPGFL